jgi:hypothetical protein
MEQVEVVGGQGKVRVSMVSLDGRRQWNSIICN